MIMQWILRNIAGIIIEFEFYAWRYILLADVVVNNSDQVEAATDQEFGCGIVRVRQHYQAW